MVRTLYKRMNTTQREMLIAIILKLCMIFAKYLSCKFQTGSYCS
uniref:Uncharacterized protein n=1 Tax=Arundo donax TaxID=35708 RepID=A0A0A9DAH1_ARUDO